MGKNSVIKEHESVRAEAKNNKKNQRTRKTSLPWGITGIPAYFREVLFKEHPEAVSICDRKHGARTVLQDSPLHSLAASAEAGRCGRQSGSVVDYKVGLLSCSCRWLAEGPHETHFTPLGLILLTYQQER